MELPPEEYQRASELFNELLDVPAGQLDSALDAACGDNGALRSEVLRLLAADRGAGRFLESGAISDGAMMLLAGGAIPPVRDTIAHYKILSKLGEGGMGEVWRAHDNKLEREVAIKILPDAFASDPDRMARFAREAQVLALLNHPNIAVIHGVEERALIMELVDGRPLLAYAAERSLGARDRLELMAKVSDGVHHAHLRGVLHRDLKPGNIFVDGSGQPKVLDFGVARILDSDSQPTRQTDLGQLIGTLDYMSPEQTMGDPRTLDIRSDIYSLGVILYELLAGRLPYETRQRALPELLRVIREDDPAPLGAIDRRYRGDIETIVNKALEKDKERRYASAAEFGDDIRRFLADEPITAIPAGPRYRAGKFFRRHRTGVAAAALFMVLILGFGIAMAMLAARTARERDMAQTERARADAVVDFLRNDVLAQANVGAQAGGAPDPNLKVRDALDRAAAKIEGKFGGQPLVEAAIRQTIGETYSVIGLLPAADAQVERALAIRRRYLPPGNPDMVASLVRLGEIRRSRGLGDHGAALLQEAVETGAKTLGEGNPEVLNAMSELAGTYIAMGRPARSEELYRKVLEVRRRVSGPTGPATASAMSDVAVSYDAQGKFAQSVELYLQAIDANSRQPHPDPVPIANLGNLYVRLGEFQRAEHYLRIAMQTAQETMNEEHPFRLFMLQGLGALYRDLGRFEEAEKLYRQAWAVRRRVLGDTNRNTLTSVSSLGDLYCTEGKWAEGEKMLLEAVNTERRVLSDEDRFTQGTMASLSLCYLRQHQFQEAEPWAARVAELRRRQLGVSHPLTRDVLMVLADIQLRRGRIEEADSLLQEACPLSTAASPTDWREFYCRSLRGASLVAARSFERAEPLLVSGYQGLSDNRSRMPAGRMMHTADAAADLVRLYENWGKPDLAARWRQIDRTGSLPPTGSRGAVSIKP
jgi:tetratricopeptide (TPR) repeat protein